ncbi:hypothetical protein OB925_10885 [Aeromonas rivipollensis]|uniref:Uncharacterized protein n=1 Tax=Aeromonas caviae TaxID=648 RepID=A0A6S4TGI4_AERCA|nr:MULTISPECIES: hypothetical protein [Aeromonas]ELB2792022.1 hypothetical protein [Aeromonas hydrophila]MDM5084019.1 hypothetical protein [Aeromonas rivipollensis]MDM5097719.1 hypothetical protein [Aeromonas rivipollensis]MDM5104795.1 hypothetical protein [Aeromonas rivipollensis]BBQ32692.1 hypothetical protein WP2W18E01_42740 [Aeromonas caviae]
MRLHNTCPMCMRDAFKATGLNVLTFKVDHHQLTDSGIHPVNCNHGHEFVIIFSGAKFEVLFDIGMNAINDGYAREAVSSFTSSLERFYEFFVSYCSYKNQIDDSIYHQAWKDISNQSERQLGAYIFTYLLKYKATPILLNNKMVSFRNSVIHKGYIPTIKEAINFGNNVYDCIMNVIKSLEENEDESLSVFYNKILPKAEGYSWTVDQSPAAICMNRKSKSQNDIKATRYRPFVEVLKSFKIPPVS